MIAEPYPELDDLLTLMGEAGERLSEIDATEGSAGNISVYLGWPVEPRTRFPLVETIDLPVSVPDLAGRTFLVTGSGRRLREVIEAPAANVACLIIDAGGRTGKLYTSYHRRFTQLTSELNTHLTVHQDQIAGSGTNFNAVVHAQPPYLTYLSHLPRYQDEAHLNAALMRWQPETIVQLPEGIGFVPFQVPGSSALMQATVESLRRHHVVIWSKHGAMACSDISVKRASDRIEYAEAAARYEYFNLNAGDQGEVGLTVDEILAICAAFQVKQNIFTKTR